MFDYVGCIHKTTLPDSALGRQSLLDYEAILNQPTAPQAQLASVLAEQAQRCVCA
jgi:hypothetical protein